MKLPGHSDTTPSREPLPARFCNLERLLDAMAARGLEGIVASTPQNVYYLTGFNGIAHKSDEPRPYAVLLSRHAPERPIMVVADYYLASFLAQPTWVTDFRPFRAVMMPLDLPPARSDIDRFIPPRDAGVAWLSGAKRNYTYDMATALRAALADLGLSRGRIAFDDPGFGMRLGFDEIEVADGYDALMYARAVKPKPNCSCSGARLNSISKRSGARLPPGNPGSPGAISAMPMRLPPSIWAASYATRAPWSGIIRRALTPRFHCRPGWRTA